MTAILTDVEGTTTDVAFVHRVLFPISRDEVPRYVRAHEGDPAIAAVRRAIVTEAGGEVGRDEARVTLDEVIAKLVGWIDADVKDTALKAIQGAIWKEAYASGALKSHVYDDIAPAFRRWQAAGISVFVFSSGSVEAQQLLFRYSVAGDLTGYLSGYFDTTTGPKKEASSYGRIAQAMGRAPGEVLFLSDVIAELDAARTAGMETTLLARPGSALGAGQSHAGGPPYAQHPRVETFDALA